MKTLKIIQPDDWHVHLRDDGMLNYTVPATAKHFYRALVMPNLKPALTTLQSLIDYRLRILQATPNNITDFNPLMTFYLNKTITITDLILTKNYPYIVGAKLYPAGVTTNSTDGVDEIKDIYNILDIMQQNNLVLQIHGETINDDIFDREKIFLTKYLQPIINNFPKLRIVLEHISTEIAVEFIKQAPANVVATITPQHLLYNRNHIFNNGINPHYYCLPILKRETDQKALQIAATSGNYKFFAGTDSAPHIKSTKETSCGCAGIYSAPYAIALYAEVFDKLDKLNNLEKFLSYFGANFYQLSINKNYLLLGKLSQIVPNILNFGAQQIVPIAATQHISWSII